MATEKNQPLADMRGCKSLHAYAVMLEKQNKELKEQSEEMRSMLESIECTLDMGVAQNGNGSLGRYRMPIKELLSNNVSNDAQGK